MITALAARWLLTVVFAAAGQTAALPRRGPAGTADAAGPGSRRVQRGDVHGSDRHDLTVRARCHDLDADRAACRCRDADGRVAMAPMSAPQPG